MKWFVQAFKRYADFRGRARRREWWWFNFLVGVPPILLVITFGVVAALFPASEGPSPSSESNPVMQGLVALLGLLLAGYALGTMVPALSVTVRRFHDVGLSAWLLLLPAAPFAFLLAGSPDLMALAVIAIQVGFLIVMLLDGQKGANKYGPDPKDRASTASRSVSGLGDKVRLHSSARIWTFEGINPEPAAPPSIRLQLDSKALGKPCTLGRKSVVVDLHVPNTSVSASHARLWEEDGRLMIEDLNSSNGTRVNGTEVAPHQAIEIFEGDQVEFGEVRLTVRC